VEKTFVDQITDYIIGRGGAAVSILCSTSDRDKFNREELVGIKIYDSPVYTPGGFTIGDTVDILKIKDELK
jgi:hypothetical protein